jgi:hypothetical protein
MFKHRIKRTIAGKSNRFLKAENTEENNGSERKRGLFEINKKQTEQYNFTGKENVVLINLVLLQYLL